jgi:hypothetical protein
MDTHDRYPKNYDKSAVLYVVSRISLDKKLNIVALVVLTTGNYTDKTPLLRSCYISLADIIIFACT